MILARYIVKVYVVSADVEARCMDITSHPMLNTRAIAAELPKNSVRDKSKGFDEHMPGIQRASRAIAATQGKCFTFWRHHSRMVE